MPERITPLHIEYRGNGELVLQLPEDFDYTSELAVARVGAVLRALESPQELLGA